MTNLSIQKHTNAVIKKPRITEKATVVTEKNQYVFEVTPEATKASVMKAIFQMYKVKPVKVNMAMTPMKKVRVRGKIGSKSAIKKAYIYLKKGDKIDIA